MLHYRSKTSDVKDDNDVNIIKEDELVDSQSQLIRSLIPKFEGMSGMPESYIYNDWALSHRNSSLSIELEVGRIFWDKNECITTIKLWYKKNSL